MLGCLKNTLANSAGSALGHSLSSSGKETKASINALVSARPVAKIKISVKFVLLI